MTRLRPLLPSLVATILACALPMRADDWPQWRGPNRDGKSAETGLLKSWPQRGPSLAWRATGLGAGFATVSVATGRIFTAGDKGDASFVLAFSEQEGKPIWAARLGRHGAPGWGNFAGVRATPTVDGDLVFAVGQYGELAAFAAATGKEIWRKSYTKDFGAKLPEWGFSESPLVDGEHVIVTPGGDQGAVLALNKRTGALAWRSKGFTDEAHYASVIRATIANEPQYVQLTAEHVVGVSLKGDLLWKAARAGQTAVIPSPIVHQDHVYVTSGYDIGCNRFQVRRQSGLWSAREVYANKVMANHHGGVILVGDHLYGHDDKRGWTCQEFLTGKAVWQTEDGLKKGSCVYADGHLVLREEEARKSRIALIEATPAGYQEKGRFEQPSQSGKKTWSHPVIANGKLYLRDQDLLLCYDVKAK